MTRTALLGVLLLAGAHASAPAAERAVVDRFPKVAKASLVAIDGRVVWEHDAATPRPPASLTKIMTALVLLDGDWDPDASVRVSARAASETGSRAGLRAGETLRAGDALAAMLIGSANDACHALAEHAAGSAGAFVEAMNARAASLGLSATRFENPCGHDAPGQRSSARDLLVLAEAALSHPEFARLVAEPRASFRTAKGRIVSVRTGNALLGRLPGASGVKTGYTPQAGKCLVGLARRGDRRVMVVLLDAPDRWWTAAALFEEAFDAAGTPR